MRNHLRLGVHIDLCAILFCSCAMPTALRGHVFGECHTSTPAPATHLRRRSCAVAATHTCAREARSRRGTHQACFPFPCLPHSGQVIRCATDPSSGQCSSSPKDTDLQGKVCGTPARRAHVRQCATPSSSLSMTHERQETLNKTCSCKMPQRLIRLDGARASRLCHHSRGACARRVAPLLDVCVALERASPHVRGFLQWFVCD